MSDIAVQGVTIDPDELLVAQLAVKNTAGTFTYMGVNVGSYITDAECQQVATAVIAAIENYRAGKDI